MNLKQKIFTTILLSNFSLFSYAEIFDDNNLNFFQEEKNINRHKETNIQTNEKSKDINEAKYQINSSDVTVHEIKELTKEEIGYFPKNSLINCKDVQKAILYVNEDTFLKIKNEFDINNKISFKKINISFYEVPFYFSENDKCIFNKDKSSNMDLKNKIMTAVKNYLALNKR